MLQRDRRSILPWRVGAGVEVFLALDHAVNDVHRSSGITNAPARHGIGLGEAVHHHGARLHARQFRNGAELCTGIQQRVIHLVRDDQQIVLFGNGRDGSQLLVGINLAGGIVRRVDHDGLCPWRDQRFDHVRLHGEPVLRLCGHAHGHAAAILHLRHIVEPLRILNQDLVAVVQDHKEQQR